MSDCKGCKLYDYDDQDCSCKAGIGSYFNSTKCPCINCLVKVMCNDVCDELADYIKSFKKDDTDYDFGYRIYAIKILRGYCGK